MCVFSHSVGSESLWPHELQPVRLLCPWNFPGKNTVVDCHFLLHGIFLTQGWNLHLLCISGTAGEFFTTSTTWEAWFYSYNILNKTKESKWRTDWWLSGFRDGVLSVYGKSNHDSPNLKTIQMSICRRMNEKTEVYPYNRLLLHNLKKTTHHKMT